MFILQYIKVVHACLHNIYICDVCVICFCACTHIYTERSVVQNSTDPVVKHHQHGGPQTDAPATFHEKTWKKGKTLKQTQIHGLKLSWKKEGYRLSSRNNIVVSGEPWLKKKTFGANPNQYYQNGFKRGLANSSWDSICCQQVHQSLTRDRDKHSHNGVLHHGCCFEKRFLQPKMV